MPASNELYRLTAKGNRQTVVGGVLDSQLTELSTAGLIGMGENTVELTDRDRDPALDGPAPHDTTAVETLDYTRGNYRVAVTVAFLTLVGVVIAGAALLNDGTGNDAGSGTSPGSDEEDAGALGPEPPPLAESIDIDVVTNPDEILRPEPIGAEYLTTVPIQDVPEPPEGLDSCVGRYEWSRPLDPVDADITNLELQVTNVGDADVRIVDIRVVVDERQARWWPRC